MKRTHKLKAIGDAKDIVGFARNRAEAADQLGVNRSTLHRWIKAGKVPEPGSARPRQQKAADTASSAAPPGRSPDEWAKAARLEREMSPTELQLIDLARAALQLAYASEDEKTQLSAMGRFSVLVKQLGLGGEAAEAGNVRDQPGAKSAVRRPASAGVDPRRILSAVK